MGVGKRRRYSMSQALGGVVGTAVYARFSGRNNSEQATAWGDCEHYGAVDTDRNAGILDVPGRPRDLITPRGLLIAISRFIGVGGPSDPRPKYYGDFAITNPRL